MKYTPLLDFQSQYTSRAEILPRQVSINLWLLDALNVEVIVLLSIAPYVFHCEFVGRPLACYLVVSQLLQLFDSSILDVRIGSKSVQIVKGGKLHYLHGNSGRQPLSNLSTDVDLQRWEVLSSGTWNESSPDTGYDGFPGSSRSGISMGLLQDPRHVGAISVSGWSFFN